ncbi:MAG: cyclodeaminase/cyclohydrolase family protein [Candidatus Omnitrophica bacterium]|nr:cyclodeaminase/cyclohydrolase family protein [Candidatus Omnitrophota bacterium]
MSNKILLSEYLDRLAARGPAPGGGSAAALTGCIGMSLLSMAAKYIAGKDKSRKIKEIIKKTGSSRLRLRRLMDEDEAAFLRLWSDLRRKKSTAGSFKAAIRAPLEVCELAAEGLKWCEYLRCRCKTSIACDLVEAAVLLEAGFLSASLNAEINLGGVKDKSYARKVRNTILKQKKSVRKIKADVLKKINW